MHVLKFSVSQSPLSRNYRAFNGKLDEFGATSQSQIFHHHVLMEGDSAWGNFQDERDFLHRSPLSQQLQNLGLTQSKFVWVFAGRVLYE